MIAFYVKDIEGVKTLVIPTKITHFTKHAGAIWIHLINGDIIKTGMYWGHIKNRMKKAKEILDIDSKRFGGW